MDYEKCYKDLLYLGWEQSIDETFSKNRSKKSYKDFQKIKDNKVISVLVVRNIRYDDYIRSLFLLGNQIETEKGTKYVRVSILNENKNISRNFLLFLVDLENLESFFNDP